MSYNKLQKKFNRGERKTHLVLTDEDATLAIQQIKALKKSTELPPPLPPEALAASFDLMTEEISRALKVKFSSTYFYDPNETLTRSSMSVDFIHALIKIFAAHNIDSLFQGTENHLLCDVNSKDILLKLSLELSGGKVSKKSENYISSIETKILAMIKPYGSKVNFRFVENLITKEAHFECIMTLNRLEYFSSSDTYEEKTVQKFVKENLHVQ